MSDFPFDNLYSSLFMLETVRGAEKLARGTPVAFQAIRAKHLYQAQLIHALSHYEIMQKRVTQLIRWIDSTDKYVHKGREHHWVPQLYLRSFRWDDDADPEKARVWALTLGETSPHDVSIKKVNVDHDLYSLDREATKNIGGPQVIEWVLSRIEDYGKGSIDWVVNHQQLNPRARRTLALFIAVQLMRHPAFAGRRGREMQLKLVTHFDMPAYADRLANQIWVLGHVQDGNKLITSDFPVVGTRGLNGEARASRARPFPEDLFVSFPLSPTLAIRIYERLGHPDFEPYDGLIRPMSGAQVEFSNALQVGLADQMIFASDANFTGVQQMLAILQSGDPSDRVRRLLDTVRVGYLP